MSRRRQRGNPVDGVLLLDKPRGITSQTAVARVKRLLAAAKAGHTGTLDPLADGLLPVCLGEATKFSQGLLDADKSYRALVRLGITTATGDLEGAVLTRETPRVTPEALTQALSRFRGDILQIPPMYSALKRDGRPLYAYARAGEEVERAARPVHIGRLELEAIDGTDLRIVVTCSKGTYIRVLAEDIGRALGCGACLAGLTRIAVGRHGIADGIGLDAFEAMDPAERLRRLLPADTLVEEFPRLDLDPEEAARLQRGMPVFRATGAAGGLIRVYAPGGLFIGMADAQPDGRVVARRLVANPSDAAATAS